MTLRELMATGFGSSPGDYENSYNCAERILNGANQVYGLGLDLNSLHLACGFGGGLFMGSACGAVCAAVMVIGCMETKHSLNQHQTPTVKGNAQKLLGEFEHQMGSLDCKELRPTYGPQNNCFPILLKIAELLDSLYANEMATEKTDTAACPAASDIA